LSAATLMGSGMMGVAPECRSDEARLARFIPAEPIALKKIVISIIK
jgi:hypothetical protein